MAQPKTAAGGDGDPADEERGHVRLLPDLEVLEQDDRDLRVELHRPVRY